MYFLDDVWNEIKKFVFHRHLWIENKDKTETIRDILNLRNKELLPMMMVSKFSYKHRFIKIYEYIQKFDFHMVSYIYIPNKLSKDEFDRYVQSCCYKFCNYSYK